MPDLPRIPLPKQWPARVKSAMLQVISLAQFATAYTRGWAANCGIERIRLRAERDRALEEAAWMREARGIKDARMARIAPSRRPHYAPTERLAILELRAAQGWSLEQTARVFQVSAATIASWMKRVDEEGPDALVQLPAPVNRFPDFVRHAVQRLKALCPSMGKVKIAQTLARAGFHLGATTVGRMLKEAPKPPAKKEPAQDTQPKIVADYPGHVYHIDLTVVPIGSGFWTSWLPFALPPCWPFCWWVAVVVDHFSRRITDVAVFASKPGCRALCAFLGR